MKIRCVRMAFIFKVVIHWVRCMLQKLGKVYFWLYLTLCCRGWRLLLWCRGRRALRGRTGLTDFFFYLFSLTPLCYNKRCLNFKGASQGYNNKYKKTEFLGFHNLQEKIKSLFPLICTLIFFLFLIKGNTWKAGRHYTDAESGGVCPNDVYPKWALP